MARIVDLTAHSAVYATRLLAEAGHEIIRVEPSQGDALRRLGPYLGGRPDLEHGAYHQYLNAGKRSLTLNLETPLGRSVLLDLVRTADVVVANLPLPVDEHELMSTNERLVLTEVEDYEPDAPEICAYARSGLLSITGQPDQEPSLLGSHVAYAATSVYAAIATAAALYLQEQTGQGQVVRVSVQESLESLMGAAMVSYATEGKSTERLGNRGANNPLSGAFPASDGYWMISVPATPEGWEKFMDWVQDPVLMADESLKDQAGRVAKGDFIVERIGRWSRQFSKLELATQAQSRHIPSAPISVPLDLTQDAQLIARGFLSEVDHPEFGRLLSPVGAIGNLVGTRLGPAPSIGQHNEEILAELGYSRTDHRALIESGAI